MARASTPTLLSLDRFAQVMGIAPPHFNGVDTGDVFPYGGQCNDVWYQYQWQGADRVSREELAREIANAEDEIAQLLGYYPSPKYFSGEVHRKIDFYRPDAQYPFDAQGRLKAIKLDNGLFVSPGRRALESVGSATTAGGTLTYTDEDGDGFNETATITLTTTLTDECEIKVFYDGETDETWEIRPHRTATISSGTLTMTFWTWQFVLPELYEVFPTADDPQLPDIYSDTSNLVTSVDVYREYTDTTEASVEFYWEPCVTDCSMPTCIACTSTCGCGSCAVCALSSQDGCMHVRNVDSSFVVPTPATYDEDDEEWDAANFTSCREPDFIKVWYQAGDVSNDYLRGRSCEKLSDYWARIISRLAIARLERPFCSCQNLEALTRSLREDLALLSDGQKSRFVVQNIQSSPFGTRRGEVEAWMKISKFVTKRNARYAIV